MARTDEEIREFLKQHGWETLWSEDNWIAPELIKRWDSGDHSFDIDRAGCSTEWAYKIQVSINNKPAEEERKLEYLKRMKEGKV